jgi:hypothetical protein
VRHEHVSSFTAHNTFNKDLMAMKVVELRAALEARGQAVSGNKAWLRRRLHTALVRACTWHVAAAEADHGV